MPTKQSNQPVTNRLLAALPKKEYRQLLPELEPVTLTFGDILYEPGEHLRHVYFPNNSIISCSLRWANASTRSRDRRHDGMAVSRLHGVSRRARAVLCRERAAR